MKPLTVIASLFLSLTIFGENSPLVEIARVHMYCEGPVFDADGNLYVSHGPFVSKIAPDGTVTRWAETGHPNGHKILADGTHLVADKQVLHLSADGSPLETAAQTCGQHATRETNDISLSPDGGFYFTDPGAVAEGALERTIGRVCFAASNGETRLVADELAFPNGIVLRPDGRTLIVGETGRNRLLEYEVLAPGQVGDMRILAELPDGGEMLHGPDGMALDTSGTLYVAHYGQGKVHVVSAEGELLESLPAGNNRVSNVAFGGDDMNELFMSGAPGTFGEVEPGVVYRVKLPGVRGLNLLPPSRR
jgi:gluconolactonase